MTTQTSKDYISTSDFFSRPLALPIEFPSVEEAQLADEMSETLPDNPQVQPHPVVDPDDFEKLYKWFLS